MVDAFGDRGATLLPKCRGRHPHLARADHNCDERLRPVLLGASNTWFPVTLTVLAIPTRANRLQQMVQDKWELFKGIASRESLPTIVEILIMTAAVPGLSEYSHDDIWKAIGELRSGASGSGDDSSDLKGPEWEIFTNPKPPQNWPDFMVSRVAAPREFQSHLGYVVLAERLREVNALVGFTRVEPPEEARDGSNPPPRAPLSNGSPEWIPATEVRGEGIFVRFNSERLSAWLARPLIREREAALLQGHKAFRAARKLTPPEAEFPGILYVLLHSFAHIFIRELALESGYSAASVRERIYAAEYGEAPGVAGVLIYTAAADSDGTLGGLVELGKPENLGRLIKQALERSRICASDPLCSEHTPTHDRSLHGAACHACTFVAETSCEIGNRYLDRSLIVPTLAGGNLAFFD
jgi:hypothetical protein